MAGAAEAYSVAGLFGQIHQLLADTNWNVSVTYDPVLGYPRSLSTSHKRITDIGHGLVVLSLEPLP